MRRFAISIVCSTLLLALAPRTASGTELKAETASAFNHYVGATETQLNADAVAGKFLVTDQLDDTRRQRAYEQIQRGELFITRRETLEDGRPIRIPNGMIHHWAGVVFIPGVTLDQVNSVLRDFDNLPKTFNPEVEQAKVLRQNEDGFTFLVRLYYKSILAVTYDVSFDVHVSRPREDQISMRSDSSRIAELRDVGGPREHELPVGNDSGFMWRFCTYWRLEKKDRGVYVQFESISLSRGIPALLVPIVKPLTESIPRKVLTDLLTDTRSAVLRSVGQTADLASSWPSNRDAKNSRMEKRYTSEERVFPKRRGTLAGIPEIAVLAYPLCKESSADGSSPPLGFIWLAG
jgi:hypothetical protein